MSRCDPRSLSAGPAARPCRSACGRNSAPNAAPAAKRQTVCKPGSVPSCDGDGHSSGTFVAERLARPTRAAARKPARHGFEAVPAAPTWSCSRWGFPCRRHYWQRGALLPHHFTLAAHDIPSLGRHRLGGVFSVALSLGSPPPAVNRHRASVEPGLSSLPLPKERPSDRLAWDDMGQSRRTVKIARRDVALQSASGLKRMLPRPTPMARLRRKRSTGSVGRSRRRRLGR
jgi:hypothetical protein